MKKTFLYLMVVMLTLSAFPSTIFAAEKKSTEITSNTKEVPAEVRIMLSRLKEIKKMDKSTMNYFEKKTLRKEVRAIKANLRSTNNGIYISMGTLVIILLLIIIL